MKPQELKQYIEDLFARKTERICLNCIHLEKYNGKNTYGYNYNCNEIQSDLLDDEVIQLEFCEYFEM